MTTSDTAVSRAAMSRSYGSPTVLSSTTRSADLVVLDNTVGDPYERLIAARETAVSLVVINGVPRYGAPTLMDSFGPASETVAVGGGPRRLFLTQPTGDPVVGALTLGEATHRLADGLAKLAALAKAL